MKQMIKEISPKLFEIGNYKVSKKTIKITKQGEEIIKNILK